MKYIRTDKIFYHPKALTRYLKGEKVIPITMELHLTNRCNLKCNYCIYADRRNKDTLTKKKAVKIIDDFVRIGVKGLIFSGGGEPTIHKDFENIVEYAYNQNLDIGFITNGIIYPDILEYLTWIRFSLDSCDREIYKKIKGADKFVQTEVAIVRSIMCKENNDLKVTIGIQMVVTKDNYKEIISMAEYSKRVGADYFQFRPLENADYPNYVWGEVNRALKYFEVSRNSIQIITSQNKWNEIIGDSKKSYKGCPGADFIGAVDAKGDFYICCHHIQDITAKYGNLLKEDIYKILNRRKKIQKNFDYSKCPIACRGSMINLALSKFGKIEHKNFL